MNNKLFQLILLALLTGSLIAGEDKRGEAGFMFLKVPIGARETSLGLTGLTHNSGAAAIYWNPANVSAADRSTFSFTYLNHFAGISSNYAAIAFPLSDIGSIGVSFNYMSYGDIVKTTEAAPGGNMGFFSPYEMAFGFTYSKQITDRVSGGMTFKFINSTIDLVSAQGIAFDFGFTYNTGYRGLKMGFTMTNLGPESKYEGDGLVRENQNFDPNSSNETAFLRFGSEPFQLPASVNFGASIDLYRNEENAILGFAEQNVNSFQVGRTNMAMEYGFKNMFFARVGYTTSFKRDRDFRTGEAATAGLTLGGGLDYKFNESTGITVDYGYMDLGQLDATHRFTVGVNF